jgi:mannose-1-phosphate guanylyltransferase/mannose-1-phosphate guanylyltransferase/mannose-6-phosphate isomerase
MYPKQLLPLVSERSLLQEAALRVSDKKRFAAPILIANDEHRFIAGEQLRQAGVAPQCILLEPIGRNTAPAACVAALSVASTTPDALLLVMPSDHAISDTPAFLAAIDQADVAARQGKLVTFGIKATRPDTGYGYIRRGKPLSGSAGVFTVEAFVEKPDRARAEKYIAAGDYVWNSGIFLFPAKLYLAEMERLRPATVAACRKALAQAKRDLDFVRLDKDSFAAAENVSIDYAVMEHTEHAAMVPCEIGWSDVGTWDALWQIGKKDAVGNVISGDIVAEDSRNNYLRAESGLLAVLGVENLVVVATSDAVMVSHRDRAQDIKQLIARLEKDNRSELTTPLGHLALDPCRQPRPGKAHHGAAGRQAQPAEAPSPRRALGRRAGHRQGDARQRRGDHLRGSIDLYPAGHSSPARESGQDRAAFDRGAIGELSRRRRYRPLRGYLREIIINAGRGK